MADLSPEQQKFLGEYLQKACEGDKEYSWLDRLALAAGYARIGAAGDRVPVTAAQLARRLGVSVRTVRVWIREGLPVLQEAHGNRPALFDAFEYFRWEQDRQTLERAIRDEEKDPLLAGAGGMKSAALEAYRREKTREARRNNELAEGRLIETEVVAVRLAGIGQVFRAKAERLERRYGADVGEAIRKMIDIAQISWEKALPIRTALPATRQEEEKPVMEVKKKVRKSSRKLPKKKRAAPAGKMKKKAKKKPAKEEPQKRDKKGRFVSAKKKRAAPAGKMKKKAKKKPTPKHTRAQQSTPKRTRVHRSTPKRVKPEKQKVKRPVRRPRRRVIRSGRQMRTRY